MMLASEHVDEPDYASVEVDLQPGVLTPTVPVHAPAELFVVHLDAGQTVSVPAAPRSLVHVTRGTIQVAGESLEAGDQARGHGCVRVRSECVRPRGRADLAAAKVTR